MVRPAQPRAELPSGLISEERHTQYGTEILALAGSGVPGGPDCGGWMQQEGKNFWSILELWIPPPIRSSNSPAFSGSAPLKCSFPQPEVGNGHPLYSQGERLARGGGGEYFIHPHPPGPESTLLGGGIKEGGGGGYMGWGGLTLAATPLPSKMPSGQER